MDEHDVVEAGTDLLLGDPKSALKKIGLSVFDKKQFEAIFVSAGKTVAEYEKDNTEQNDIRKILFCEETMRLLANEIRKSNSFDWLNDLDRCVNDLLSLSELDSMEKYIIRYPDSVTTSQMLEKIVKLIELRKEPGLLSAIWILHNLVYTKNTVIDTIGIERIDRLLFFLAELINYDNAAMKDIKHCIELRQACAALAFRLFDWKTVNCGKGVEKWREICKSSDEANEVRNQWIW